MRSSKKSAADHQAAINTRILARAVYDNVVATTGKAPEPKYSPWRAMSIVIVSCAVTVSVLAGLIRYATS